MVHFVKINSILFNLFWISTAVYFDFGGSLALQAVFHNTVIIIILYSFVCYFSKVEHTSHYKAKNTMYQITLKSVLVIDWFVKNAILLYLSPPIKTETIEEKDLNFHTFFTCHVSMYGCCLSLAVLHWVVSHILADYFSGCIAHKTKQDSLNPLFKAVF